MSSSDEVRLVVPSLPEYLRLARVTAAGLASRLGFSFDEVEDLRLAIDELCYGLTGSTGRPGTVEITYTVNDGGLVVDGRSRFEAPGGTTATLSELSQVILAALVDEHELFDGDGGPGFRLVKRSRHREESTGGSAAATEGDAPGR